MRTFTSADITYLLIEVKELKNVPILSRKRIHINTAYKFESIMVCKKILAKKHDKLHTA